MSLHKVRYCQFYKAQVKFSIYPTINSINFTPFSFDFLTCMLFQFIVKGLYKLQKIASWKWDGASGLSNDLIVINDD